MEKDQFLYWKHFKIWIFGTLFSFPISGIFGYLFRVKDRNLMIPILVGILFLPIVFHGAYGLRHGYCMSYRYGYIHRGAVATFGNIFDLILYIGIILVTIIMGGRNSI
jgi:succinate dehydrogenase/fumarate reductase cytochrome b subunit